MAGMRRCALALVTLALVALALVPAGCGGGSPEQSGVHAGGVSNDTYVAVVKALKAYGVSIASESDLRMTYGTDRRHVTVTGGGMRLASKTASGTPATVASVNLELVGSTWRVLNVTGNY